MFAFPTAGNIEKEFFASFASLMLWDRDHERNIGNVTALRTTNVANGRNKIAQACIDGGFEWLLFADDDMVFDPDVVDRMLAVTRAAPEVRILSALCFAQLSGGQIVPTFCAIEKKDGEPKLIRPNVWPLNNLFQVGVVGTGFMLIHREVLLALRDRWQGHAKWFDWSPWGDEDMIGEDYTFCLRAGSPHGNREGYDGTGPTFGVFVDPRIEVGHVKSRVVNSFEYGRALDATITPPNFVAIPVKGEHTYTEALLRQLGEQAEYTGIFVFDNGADTDPYTGYVPDACQVVPAAGMNIHEMWNAGIKMARQNFTTCNIAILNNDLEVGPHFLSGLAAALRSNETLFAVCPNYDSRDFEGDILAVRGIAAGREDGTGGLAGFAFMVRGELYDKGFPLFDENYKLWYGDNDFVQNVELAGGLCGVVKATSVVHIDGGSKTAGDGSSRLKSPELERWAAEDREYFIAKWRGAA